MAISDYSVSSLWRYPVKSMAGEALLSVDVTNRGLAGDRAYALVDTASNTVGSAKNAKRFGSLLKCQPRFLSPVETGKPAPALEITMPDGSVLRTGQLETGQILAREFGSSVTLASGAPEGLTLEFAAGTLGGKFSQTTSLPVSSGAPPGTLFNYAAVHLVTTATLKQLGISRDRFRPNIVVETGDEEGFPENSWVGRTIAVGPQVVLKVSIPCPRCVVTTLPRADLPQDASVLPTVKRQNTVNLGDFGDLPCVGVYADVIRDGTISRSDRIRILD